MVTHPIYHVFHECEESSDFESCFGELDVQEGLVELAVDMDMCAVPARSKDSNTDKAGAASDAMWSLVDSGPISSRRGDFAGSSCSESD